MQPIKLVLALLLLMSVMAVSVGAERKIKFSKEDVAVLKRIRDIKSISTDSAKLILSAPVFALLSSPKPVDVLITISTSEWDKLAEGATNVQKVAVCQIEKELQYHLSDAVSDRVPTGEALAYFQRLYNAYGKRC